MQDARLDSGYEAVPTRDIHMKQVGLDDTWLRFLKLFVKPLVENVFPGYESDVCFQKRTNDRLPISVSVMALKAEVVLGGRYPARGGLNSLITV